MEFFPQRSFNKMNDGEFAGIIRGVPSHTEVKEVSWGDGSKMKAAENEK